MKSTWISIIAICCCIVGCGADSTREASIPVDPDAPALTRIGIYPNVPYSSDPCVIDGSQGIVSIDFQTDFTDPNGDVTEITYPYYFGCDSGAIYYTDRHVWNIRKTGSLYFRATVATNCAYLWDDTHPPGMHISWTLDQYFGVIVADSVGHISAPIVSHFLIEGEEY